MRIDGAATTMRRIATGAEPKATAPLALAGVLLLASAAWAQNPDSMTRGTWQSADGRATPIQWTAEKLKASSSSGALCWEVEPKVAGTADSAPLALDPLHLYTITMTCRRGPGLGLTVWVKWTDADGKPGTRQMIWQLSDRFRVNWWPLSAHKNTYVQRFCLPAGASRIALQVAMTGHPDAGYNQFELHELTVARGPKIPFGPNLGSNLCPGGDMEAATAEGMAVGWGFWGTPPDAKVKEKDSQGRPSHGGKRFLAFPAGKNCILAHGVIAIQPARAYRVSLWARGKGDLGLGVHALEPVEGQRVGDPQQVPLHVDSADWQPFHMVWFAEALHAAHVNLFIGIHSHTELDLDDIMVQPIAP